MILRVISDVKSLILRLVRRYNHVASAWLLKALEIIILPSMIVIVVVTINCLVVTTHCRIDCADSVSTEPLEAHLATMLVMMAVINLKQGSQLGRSWWQLVLTNPHRHLPRWAHSSASEVARHRSARTCANLHRYF